MNERKEDRIIEADGIARIAAMMRAPHWIFPPTFPVDGLILQGKITRIVEFKRRNNPRYQWDDLRIDRAKIIKGLSIAHLCDGRFLLAIQWDDEFAGRLITADDLEGFKIIPDWKNHRGEVDEVFCIPVRGKDWRNIP